MVWGVSLGPNYSKSSNEILNFSDRPFNYTIFKVCIVEAFIQLIYFIKTIGGFSAYTR
jgi:hypothetical protein